MRPEFLKIILFSFSVSLTAFHSPEASAQIVPSIQWQRTFGGNTNEEIYGFLWSADEILIGGPSLSPVSGNKTSPTYGSSDYWFLRLDPNGNKTSENSFGGTGGDTLTCIKKTSDQGYALGGVSTSTNSGTKTSVRWGSGDYWLVRTDANGNQIWDASFGGTSSEVLWSIDETQDGGFILAGTSASDANGNKTTPRLGNIGGSDIWIVRVDTNGNKLWDKSFGGTNVDDVHRVLQLADGGFIIAGNSDSGISGNKTNAGYGGSDYWLIRLDTDGNKLWERVYGGNSTEYLYDLQQTTDGFILAGSSTSGVSGNKTTANFGGQDFWIVRVDTNGVILWQKSFGGSASEEPNSAKQTLDGGFIVGGYSYSGLSGNKTSGNYGVADCWVVRLDGAGNKLWDNSYGGTAYDFIAGISQTSDGGYLFGAFSNSGMSGNKTVAGYGGDDAWIVKIGPEPPRLTYARSANLLTLAWPDWAFGFRLEETASLAVPSWSATTNSSSTNAGTISVALPLTAQTRFYRLAK
jgi:hypothetical protein